MRDMVEVGWGGNKLGANISVHIRQATLFDFESKSIRTTVMRKEEEEKTELAEQERPRLRPRPHDEGEI